MGADSGVCFTSEVEAADSPFDFVENGFCALSKYCLSVDKQLEKWYVKGNIHVEVVNLSRAKYPNRDALRQANDIYLDTMRPFIIHYLKQVPGETVEDLIGRALTDEQADKFWEKLDENNDIESAIDFSYFPLIIKNSWLITRNRRNYGFAQRFNEDMTVQSMLWLIREGRNSCEHRGKKDLDSEFVRINLFLIADVLGKINRPDEQREIEGIRDALFADDTKERLAATSEELKKVKTERTKYKKSLAEVEKHLEAAQAEGNDYEERLEARAKELDAAKNQLKKVKAENTKYKKSVAETEKDLEVAQAEGNDYKGRFETTAKELENTKAKWQTSEDNLKSTSDRLEDAVGEWVACVERLTAIRKLFATATIGNREVQTIFPPFETDSAVRILDRRNVDKQNYLLNLLEQKQPTVIYVQSEERIDQLLTLVGPEKADVIRKCDERTSEVEETEILAKLENKELIAIVSNTAFSTLAPSHRIEHFVFCHLVPGLDEFFRQCEPAFTSEKNAYLHLIYNSEQDIEGLAQKYPDREALEKLYPELRKLAGTNGNFVKTESLYSELDIAKPGIETGFAIFKELQLLERGDEGIKLLPPAGKKLDASEIYCRGEKLKNGTADFQTFQFEQSIEQIWEALLKELNVGNEQILDESSVYKVRVFQNAIRDSGTQSEQSTEAVENDSKADDEVSEVQSERPTETVENDNTVDGEDAEAKQTPKSTRANAKVTEEQVREIRTRREAGESYNELAQEFGLTPTTVRNIALRKTWKHVE